MNEACCQFGEEGRLVGIVSEPEEGPRGPACVLVSAGLVPKHGPYRLYTQLARKLAKQGLVAMRFDLGGLGDSQPLYAGQSLQVRTMRETQAAVDYVTQRYDLREVVLAGLCSGAEDSFRYAERDPRVAGVVLIDPFAYRTLGFGWRNLMHRALTKSLRLLHRVREVRPFFLAREGGQESSGRAIRTSSSPAPARSPLINYQHMRYEEASRILRALMARRVFVHFVYTGGTRDFNHRTQIESMFPGIDMAGRVTVDHLPYMDHTQVLEEDRETLVAAISSRLAGLCDGWQPTGPNPPFA